MKPEKQPCSNMKAKWGSEELARMEIPAIKQKYGVDYLRPYKCDGCGNWHLTSSPSSWR